MKSEKKKRRGTIPQMDYIQVLFQWLCYKTGSGMFLCYLNIDIIQKHNKLLNNAITMSFMFNIYDSINMNKIKHFGLYFDHLQCEMQ